MNLLRYAFLFLLVFISTESFGQILLDKDDKEVSTEPRSNMWSYETLTWKTAGTVAKGEMHLQTLAPIRYGLFSYTELQTYPLLLLGGVPNLSAKISWYNYHRWKIATKHGAYYPTLGLGFLQSVRNDILDKDAKIPQILMFSNEIITSYTLNPTCNKEVPHWYLTGRLGLNFGIVDNIDPSFHRMTYMWMYHRTAPFYKDLLGYFGLQLDGGLTKQIYFNIGADIYGVKLNNLDAVEAQLNLIYHKNYRLSFSLGCKFIKNMNNYSDSMEIFPTVDICYRLWRKGELYMGLF